MLQITRQYFLVADVLRDIELVVKSTNSADVITFTGDGEPTLSRDLGLVICTGKQEFGLPVAVISKGSLLSGKEV